MSFDTLGLCQSVLRAVRESGYEVATAIQTKAVPSVLEGRDLMGCAQTGTGKTAAFALPTLHKLFLARSQPNQRPAGNGKKEQRPIKALVVAPTRELAAQIAASFAKYGKYTNLRSTVIFGGVGQQPQVRALRAGVDILIATPGRLLDLMNQRHVDLSKVEILVLDEADQMLDMGFLPDMRRIVAATPRDRQTLMFSATMPDEIRRLANQWLHDPCYVEVTPAATPVESVRQSVYFVDRQHKPQMLSHYLQNTACVRTLIFVRTKHGADKIVKHLVQTGIRAEAIHGNKTQSARTRSLERFRAERPPVLVATDIAARGLDVKGVSHVVNYELPEVPEIYVHRIGRTARAGAVGNATTFCDGDEQSKLKRIERLTRQQIPVVSAGVPFARPARAGAKDVTESSNGPERSPRFNRNSARSSGRTKSRRPQRGSVAVAAKAPATTKQHKRRRRVL